MINTIQLGNCLDILTQLPDASVDCVITDPPYFIDRLDDTWNVKNDSNSHITHLPKGMKFSRKQTDTLLEFYTKVSKLVYQKLKPGGYFLSFSSPRLYHSIAMACHQGGFEIRDMINWVYTQSMPKGMSMVHLIEKMDLSTEEKARLRQEYTDFKTPMVRSCFEPVCVAMKPLSETSFLRNELVHHTGLIDFSQKVGRDSNRVPANIITTEAYTEMYDKNFLVSKPGKKEKMECNTHLTVKPIEMIEHLIELFSKKGSLVVDPFIGSGTTALACLHTGRDYIGIEQNQTHYDIALQRIAALKNTMDKNT